MQGCANPARMGRPACHYQAAKKFSRWRKKQLFAAIGTEE
jgi:hypothetical protein